ncbi:hypothetical protein ZIOFF_009741 [Zingiber officinale]|uniref:Sodium/calcium exchanger membrane region domain-containing protein n=1 Tax=Zingiber officinale TaxID=94328 RepID=A0A8J5HNI3_ZINOF|nr:hypothetical protein ZIOFF_009741 [Zingiber officinale]
MARERRGEGLRVRGAEYATVRSAIRAKRRKLNVDQSGHERSLVNARAKQKNMRGVTDITLGVSLGSATQISMFVVPLCVMVAWIMGIKMDLDLNLLETGSLIMSILVIAFTLQTQLMVLLQDGTSHYLKGLVPLLCYLAIGACFSVFKSPLE